MGAASLNVIGFISETGMLQLQEFLVSRLLKEAERNFHERFNVELTNPRTDKPASFKNYKAIPWIT